LLYCNLGKASTPPGVLPRTAMGLDVAGLGQWKRANLNPPADLNRVGAVMGYPYRALISLLVFWALPALASALPRQALVIGNANYQGEATLRNTLNDAEDVGAQLKSLGFEVGLLRDAESRAMRRGINDFLDRVSRQPGIALIYYSGHAVQDSSRANYLLPVDAQIKRESDIRSDGVAVNAILEQFGVRPDGAVSLLLLDACRNNPFATGTRGANRGLARVEPPPGGTLVLYAASPGQTADDNQAERNGLFTKHLLTQLPRPGLDIEDAFEQVALQVKQASGNRQLPYKEGNLLGKHYLSEPTPTAAQATPLPAPAAAQPADLELKFWESTERCGSEACLRSYLDTYPQGSFAPLARARLAPLASAAPRPEAKPLTAPLPVTPSGPEQAIQGLIERYLQMHNNGDAGLNDQIYAEQVDYFTKADASLSFIQQDKRAYFKRWPRVSMTLLAPVQIGASATPNQWPVQAQFRFDVYNAQRREGIRGISQNDFVVRARNGEMRITSQREKVTQREKYP
jgi:hypothetical protein